MALVESLYCYIPTSQDGVGRCTPATLYSAVHIFVNPYWYMLLVSRIAVVHIWVPFAAAAAMYAHVGFYTYFLYNKLSYMTL